MPRWHSHSHICIVGKSSWAKVCIDLCKHYWFCHKMTILVTLVLKIYYSISSFLRNFSNSQWKNRFLLWGHPWAGLRSLVDWPHPLQKGWRRAFTEMRTGGVSWRQAHSIPQQSPSQSWVKMKDQQLTAFHHGETSLPVRCRCLSSTTRCRHPFSSERGNHSMRSCCSQLHAQYTNKL